MTTTDLRLSYKMETGENPEDSVIESIELSITDEVDVELEDFAYVIWLEEELIKSKEKLDKLQ